MQYKKRAAPNRPNKAITRAYSMYKNAGIAIGYHQKRALSIDLSSLIISSYQPAVVHFPLLRLLSGLSLFLVLNFAPKLLGLLVEVLQLEQAIALGLNAGVLVAQLFELG
jgi:hypothetical protein